MCVFALVRFVVFIIWFGLRWFVLPCVVLFGRVLMCFGSFWSNVYCLCGFRLCVSLAVFDRLSVHVFVYVRVCSYAATPACLSVRVVACVFVCVCTCLVWL